MADWLLDVSLKAIADARPELAGWCETKKVEEASGGRLGALRFICNQLDATNRRIVADALVLDLADLEACGRVLRAI